MSDPFNPVSGLVLVTARVSGPTGSREVRLAVDTAATETVISRRVLENVGLNTRTGPTVPVIMGGGTVLVPLVTADALEALGQTQRDLAVQAHTLPTSLPIDGLMGLDFFRGYRLVVDFRTGRISLT